MPVFGPLPMLNTVLLTPVHVVLTLINCAAAKQLKNKNYFVHGQIQFNKYA